MNYIYLRKLRFELQLKKLNIFTSKYLIYSYINYKLFVMFIGLTLKLHVNYEKEHFPLIFLFD
jgi:hypothetical protein